MTPPSLDRDACLEKLTLLDDLLVNAEVISHDLAARLRPSAGMRNILTHEYGAIDLDRVAAAVPKARRDYGDYVDAVRERLRSGDGS